MTRRALLAATLLGTLLSSTARAEQCRIAVLDLEAQGLPADEVHLPRALSDALAAAVAERSGCAVLTREDMTSLMGLEAERQACGVESDACVAEMGAALGAQRMVLGSVSRIGAATTVSVRLLDVARSVVDARAEETTSDVSTLRALTTRVGQRLFPAVPTPRSVSALAVGGGVVAGVGVLALAGGALLAIPAESTLGEPTAPRADKDAARTLGQAGLVVGAVGGVLLVGGVAAGLVGVME